MLPKVFFCKECGRETIHYCRKREKEEKVVVFYGMMLPKKIPKEYVCIKCGMKTIE